MINLARAVTISSGVLLLTASQAAVAAAFYISEVGTPGSLGTAGVGNPTNVSGADSAWTNPAGMTGVGERTLSGGLTLAIPRIEFSPDIATKGGGDGGNAGAVAPIPGTFYVHPLSDRTRVGFSLTAPMGGEIDYGDNFVGRYSVTKVQLMGVGATGSVGHKLTETLSIGGSVGLVYTKFDQDIAINQGPLPDAKVSFDDLDDWGVKGTLGLTWQMTDRVLFGAVYRTEFDANLKGDVKLSGLAVPFTPSGTINIDWTNPQWLDLGLRVQAAEDLDLLVAGGWQEWSAFSDNELGVTFPVGVGTAGVIDRDWDDTWYLGVGMQKNFGQTRQLSLGVKYESSPVSDANRTFDLPFDETWTISASYGWTGGGHLSYALGASLLYGGDAPIDNTSQFVRVKGDYDSNWVLFAGGSVRYRF